MTISQYLPFANAIGANTLSFTGWSALNGSGGVVQQGFQPGLALSEHMNTVLRQLSVAVAGVSKLSVDYGSIDQLDDGSVANYSAALKNALDAIIASQQFWKPGDTKQTFVNVVPAGWLKCNGAVVSRATYADLFAAISTTYNTGGESGSTFRLPDVRGRFLRSWADDGSINAGRGLGTAEADALKAHTHGFTSQFGRAIADGNTANPGGGLVQYGGTALPGVTDSTGSTETRPVNTAVLTLIKT